jgi:hypothetical protein
LATILASWITASSIMAAGSPLLPVSARMLGSYAGPLMGLVFAYVGEVLRRLNSDYESQAARKVATQRRSATIRAGLERWNSENAPLIEFVSPMLVRIASGDAISPAMAQDCKALEACCRDYLRSPGFVDRQLLAIAFEARRQGCEIVLDIASPPPEPLLSALRAAVADAVRCRCTTLVLTRIAGGPTTFVVKGSATSLQLVADAVQLRLTREASLNMVPTFLGTALLLELTADSA